VCYKKHKIKYDALQRDFKYYSDYKTAKHQKKLAYHNK